MKAVLLFILLGFLNHPLNLGVIKSYKTNSAASSMSILGTSTLHDWEMTAANLQGSMHVDLYQDSLDIQDLSLVVPVASLKSGKRAMDNNAYKALKAKDHKEIKYRLKAISKLKKTSDGSFMALSTGVLQVAGVSKTLNIPITVKVQKGGIVLSGTSTFKMSLFDVEAPSFMMGAVSTGDEITINFSINYN